MKREEILKLMKAKDVKIQAYINFNKNAFGTIKQSVMDVESVPDQQNQQVITSAKQEDDKVVLSALNFLAILLAFIVLWVFIYLAF